MQFLKKMKGLSEKNKILGKNIIGAFCIKGIALIVSLYTMPAYMKYFENQQILGIWFTLLSIMSWILNFDLGIGNGLRNHLTEALTQNDYKLAKQYISSAYWMLGIVVIFFTAIGYFLVGLVPWNAVFNIEKEVVSQENLLVVVKIVFVGMMLQFFLRLITSILYAMQKSAINNLLSLITSILQLLFVLYACNLHITQSLQVFAIAYVICANVPLLVVTIIVFAKPMRKCVPSFSKFKFDKARSVLSLGAAFFVCQILYMLIANTNELLITNYTSPDKVVEYQIYNKLYTLGNTLFMLALTPVWSAVSKAVAEKDFFWLKKASTAISKFSCVAIVAEFLLTIVLQFVVDLWLGEESIQINYFYGLCFAMFGATMVYQCTVSTIANGIGKLKNQIICYGIGILLKLVVAYIGIHITGEWIFVIIANTLVLVPYCILEHFSVNRYIRESGGR